MTSLFPPRESLVVTSRLGTGNFQNFLRCMIYPALYVMLLMRANALRGQVGRGRALEIKTFLGPVKWHRVVKRVPFGAVKEIHVIMESLSEYYLREGAN
jgi:hypothetical protein